MFAKQIDEREADIETAELLSGEKQNHILGETKEEQALRWRNFKGMEERELHKHFVERVFVFWITEIKRTQVKYTQVMHAQLTTVQLVMVRRGVIGVNKIGYLN